MNNIPLALMVKACHAIVGLTTICPQTEMKDHLTSLGVRVVNTLSLPAVVIFLGRDYWYKLHVILRCTLAIWLFLLHVMMRSMLPIWYSYYM